MNQDIYAQLAQDQANYSAHQERFNNELQNFDMDKRTQQITQQARDYAGDVAKKASGALSNQLLGQDITQTVVEASPLLYKGGRYFRSRGVSGAMSDAQTAVSGAANSVRNAVTGRVQSAVGNATRQAQGVVQGAKDNISSALGNDDDGLQQRFNTLKSENFGDPNIARTGVTNEGFDEFGLPPVSDSVRNLKNIPEQAYNPFQGNSILRAGGRDIPTGVPSTGTFGGDSSLARAVGGAEENVRGGLPDISTLSGGQSNRGVLGMGGDRYSLRQGQLVDRESGRPANFEPTREPRSTQFSRDADTDTFRGTPEVRANLDRILGVNEREQLSQQSIPEFQRPNVERATLPNEGASTVETNPYVAPEAQRYNFNKVVRPRPQESELDQLSPMRQTDPQVANIRPNVQRQIPGQAEAPEVTAPPPPQSVQVRSGQAQAPSSAQTAPDPEPQPSIRPSQPTAQGGSSRGGVGEEEQLPSFSKPVQQTQKPTSELDELGDIAKKDVAPAIEGEVESGAAELPGVGEVLMGVTAIGGLIGGLFEHHSEQKKVENIAPAAPPPPVAPPAAGGMSFEVAPTIDSTNFHNQ